MRRRWPQLAATAIVLLIALVVTLLNSQRGASEQPTSPTASRANSTVIASAAAASGANQRPAATATARSARPTATTRGLPPSPTPDGKLPTVAVDRLPREAQETLRLIDAGGPFPYDRDGITFGNRERLLPIKPEGYYREYTVITPGSADRGARRIVAGREGEFYYTDDHYESFNRVIR